MNGDAVSFCFLEILPRCEGKTRSDDGSGVRRNTVAALFNKVVLFSYFIKIITKNICYCDVSPLNFIADKNGY